MSWSRVAQGNAQEVLEKVRAWKASQHEIDRSWANPVERAGVTVGHGVEVDAAVAAVESMVSGLTHLPTEQIIEVSASGHSNLDGTGQVFITIHHTKPQ